MLFFNTISYWNCSFSNYMSLDNSQITKNKVISYIHCLFSNISASSIYFIIFIKYFNFELDVLFSFTSISQGIIFSQCKFISLNLNKYLFDISYSILLFSNLTFDSVFSENGFVGFLYNSNLKFQYSITVNCSNGMFYLQESNMNITNSNFNNSNSIVGLSSIIVAKSIIIQKLLIINSSFFGFSAYGNGSILNIAHTVLSLIINNCSFQNNEATYGGVIYIYYSGNVTISNCSFYQNLATYGGTLYYDDSFNTFLFLNLNYNTFEQNYAKVSGGAAMLNKRIPQNFTNNVFLSNKADGYGGDFASEANRVLYIGENFKSEDIFDISKFNTTKFVSLKISSGSVIPITLNFVIVDIFYQRMNAIFSM